MRYVVVLQGKSQIPRETYFVSADKDATKVEYAFVFTDRGAAEVIAAHSGGGVRSLDPEPGEDAYTDLRAKIFTLASDYEHSANQYEIAMRNDSKAKEQRRQEWFVTASVFRNVASQLRSTLP